MTNLWHLYGHEGQGHFEVKVILESNDNVFRFLSEAGSWLLSECLSCLFCIEVILYAT